MPIPPLVCPSPKPVFKFEHWPTPCCLFRTPPPHPSTLAALGGAWPPSATANVALGDVADVEAATRFFDRLVQVGGGDMLVAVMGAVLLLI